MARDSMQQGLSLGVRLGMEFVVATLIGAGLGYWLDQTFGTKPWIMLGGLALGVGAGLRNVYRLLSEEESPKK
jgi:ATP synthase protein I